MAHQISGNDKNSDVQPQGSLFQFNIQNSRGVTSLLLRLWCPAVSIVGSNGDWLCVLKCQTNINLLLWSVKKVMLDASNHSMSMSWYGLGQVSNLKGSSPSLEKNGTVYMCYTHLDRCSSTGTRLHHQ